jgi:hypothetical protein
LAKNGAVFYTEIASLSQECNMHALSSSQTIEKGDNDENYDDGRILRLVLRVVRLQESHPLGQGYGRESQLRLLP